MSTGKIKIPFPKILVFVDPNDKNEIERVEQQLYGNKFIIRFLYGDVKNTDIQNCNGVVAYPPQYLQEINILDMKIKKRIEYSSPQNLKEQILHGLENIPLYENEAPLRTFPGIKANQAKLSSSRGSLVQRVSTLRRSSLPQSEDAPKVEGSGGRVTKKRTVAELRPVYRPTARRVSLRTVR